MMFMTRVGERLGASKVTLVRLVRPRGRCLPQHPTALDAKHPTALATAMGQGGVEITVVQWIKGGDDVVRCFIKATLKHSKAPGAVRASKKRYPFLRPVISRGCQG